VEEAPWEVTQAFIDEHQIDYIAHGQSSFFICTLEVLKR